MRFSRQIAIALATLLCAVGMAAAQAPKLDAKTQAEVVNKIAESLRDNYVFPDVAEKAGKLVQAEQSKGAYANVTNVQEFAERLTHDLQSVSHDKHMRVFMAPPEPKEKEDPAQQELRFIHQDSRNNFGFVKLERLSGNVGYLDLRGFSPAQYGGPTAIAAMNFLANSDAVIIDLRKNGGGDPSMIQLISSYFFKDATHLNNLYWRKGDHTDQFWTSPYVSGKKMADTPLYVLTSARTFSGAEEFTNNMKVLKRAKIIGETTGGGANPGGFFPLAAGLGMFIPTGRAVNPVTGKNWEGTGVEPDEKVPAADAFNVAYKEALKGIEESSKDEQAKADAAWARFALEAQMKPVKLSNEDLAKIAGNYGTRHVTAEQGQLYLQLGDGPRRKLSALTPDTFVPEGAEAPRLKFASGKLTEMFPDGMSRELSRD
ncbi:MAG TPA: S41 family peptidase [Candidatus Limnocylindrales bacterium]|nr:S41 family peptidase [Candidatus Limnocylindrales bacterium]